MITRRYQNIVHSAASSDLDYSGIAVIGVTSNITDNDGSPVDPPTELTAADEEDLIELEWEWEWESSSTPGVTYNLYRSTTSGGPAGAPYVLVISGLTERQYEDESVTVGVTYYYVVTAVDSSGSQSSYSNEASTTPSG